MNGRICDNAGWETEAGQMRTLHACRAHSRLGSGSQALRPTCGVTDKYKCRDEQSVAEQSSRECITWFHQCLSKGETGCFKYGTQQFLSGRNPHRRGKETRFNEFV